MSNKTRNGIIRSRTGIRCTLLYIKHMALLRSLRIDYAYLQDAIVIKGNPINIIVSVKGCHRIKISEKTLPGTIKSLELKTEKIPDSLSITFYGVLRRTKRQINILSCGIKLQRQFYTESVIPKATASDFYGKKAVSDLQNIKIHNTLSPAMQICITSQQVMLDPFEIKLYI